MSNITEWYTRHAKRVDKKYYAKGESIYVLHRRTLQTAKSIIDLINDIPADDARKNLTELIYSLSLKRSQSVTANKKRRNNICYLRFNFEPTGFKVDYSIPCFLSLLLGLSFGVLGFLASRAASRFIFALSK